MPLSVFHSLTATTPDDPLYEIKPSNWNSLHVGTLDAAGSEISNAFSNANNITFGLETNGFITASASYTNDGAVAISAGTNSRSTGTVNFSNSNGMTFGMSNNGVVTASYTVPTVPAQTEYVFSNSNGVSFGTNGSTVTATVKTDYLTTAMASNRGTDFVQATAAFAGTNASGTIASNGISVSVNAGGGGVAISGGANSQSTGTVNFSNSNGVSFGLSNNGVMTATVKTDYLTTARASNDAIGLNTALTGNGVAWTVNSSGLSLNVPAFLTTAAQSNHSHGNPTLALTNINGTTASASNGLTLSLSAIVPAQTQQPMYFSLSNSNTSANTMTFGNLNGVSWSYSNNSIVASVKTDYLTTAAQSNQVVNSLNGSTGQISLNVGSSLSASTNGSNITFGLASNITTALQSTGNYLTTARASTDAIGLNTAQSNVIWTVNSSGLSLDARGYAGTGFSGTNATATLNSNGLQLSVGAGGGGTTNQTGPNIGVSNLGATAGSTGTVSTGNVVFAGTNGILLSQSTGAAGSNATISIMPQPISAWANQPYMPNSQTIQPRQSTSVVFPAYVNNAISFDHIRFPLTVSMGSTSLATTANTTFSAGVFYTFNVGFYETLSSNATSLVSALTTNAFITETIGVSANANGSQYTVQFGITHPTQTGNSNFGSTINLSNASFQISTTGLTAFTGMKHFEIPLAASLDPNMYWVAYGVSSTTSTQGIAGLSSPLMLHSNWGMSQPNNAWGLFGQANNASIQNISGNGSFTTAGGGTVAGFGFSNISSSASHVIPYIYAEYDG